MVFGGAAGYPEERMNLRRRRRFGFFACAALLVSLVLSGGCNTQETTGAPDAAPAPCDPGPFIFCQPVAANEPGCNTDEGSSVYLTRLPKSTRYPLGCVINYGGARDEQGDCKLEAVCKCILGEVIAPPIIPDAGPPDASDAGDAGDAGDGGRVDAGRPDAAPPPPPVDAGRTTGPVWFCQ